jgi:ribonuclease P protein component
VLPKQNRLPLRTEFKRLRKEGQIFQGKLFGLLLSPSLKTPSRFAFIISTKVHKKAVQRNHARRLLSEAIKEFLPQIKPGFNGVILAKKALIEANLSQIKQEVSVLFRRANLIK